MLHLRRAATALAARGAGQASKAAAPAGPSAAAGLKARFGTTPQRRLAEKAAKEGVEAEAGEAAEAAGGWLKGFAKSKIRLLAAAALGVLSLNAGASAAFDYCYHKRVLDTLIRGVLPPPQAPPLLARDELCQRMRELLAPPEPSSFFHIVTGPPGGGKSTLLREAVRSLGAGVGYIEVSPAYEVDWGRDLGAAFNFRFQEHVKAANVVAKPMLGTQYEDPHSKHPLASVRQSAEALHDAALEFRKRTGRPFVLVIDSADRLAHGEDSDRVLRAMVDYARDWAQAGVITTVFVAADWSTVERLAGDHPAQSRAAPPLRVPDITADEALHYLEALGVEGKLAGKCAELVGGSLLLLQRCAYMSGAGMPFPEVKQQLLDLIEIAYVQAGLLDDTPQREGGLAAVEALLKSRSGAIGAAEWRAHVPSREQQLALLSRGVIRFDGRQLRFASRLAAAYAAEVLAGRLPPAVADRHRGLHAPGWW